MAIGGLVAAGVPRACVDAVARAERRESERGDAALTNFERVDAGEPGWDAASAACRDGTRDRERGARGADAGSAPAAGAAKPG